ncbi:hypothetical protein NC651_030652 [Populus alba x Populus x berolinensis]|nr:hypothetical protein NC651_030652 [Populus alba x Populus x berolinensis]
MLFYSSWDCLLLIIKVRPKKARHLPVQRNKRMKKPLKKAPKILLQQQPTQKLILPQITLKILLQSL